MIRMPKRSRIATTMLVLLALVLVAGLIAYQMWQDPQRRFNRAREALCAGELEAVRAEVDALADYPLYAPHRHFLRGALLLWDGQSIAALPELKTSADHPDLERDSLVLAGQALYQLGLAGNAKLHWEKALRLDPDCTDAFRWLGVLAYDIGAFDQAIDQFQRVSEIDPQDPRSERMIGMIHWMLDRPELAIEHYRESLRRSVEQPDVDDVRTELAECQMKVHDYAAAEESLLQCQRSARQRTLLADSHFGRGQLDEALQAAQEALTIQPDFFLALRTKGDVLLGRGDAETATEVLTEAVKQNPSDYRARFQLAAALRRLGKLDEAATQTEQGTKLRETWQEFSDAHLKTSEQPTNRELRLRLGDLAQQLSLPDLAMSWYRAALTVDPNYREAAERLMQTQASLAQPSAGKEAAKDTAVPPGQ